MLTENKTKPKNQKANLYASATKHLGIGLWLVGRLVTNFKKVEMMSCKVYTVQSVYTGQGPGTVHVYTQLWEEHSQE